MPTVSISSVSGSRRCGQSPGILRAGDRGEPRRRRGARAVRRSGVGGQPRRSSGWVVLRPRRASCSRWLVTNSYPCSISDALMLCEHHHSNPTLATAATSRLPMPDSCGTPTRKMTLIATNIPRRSSKEQLPHLLQLLHKAAADTNSNLWCSCW